MNDQDNMIDDLDFNLIQTEVDSFKDNKEPDIVVPPKIDYSNPKYARHIQKTILDEFVQTLILNFIRMTGKIDFTDEEIDKIVRLAFSFATAYLKERVNIGMTA